ncbi:MAG: FAD-dependent oxidoreductase [Halanaerobiales bacterium]
MALQKEKTPMRSQSPEERKKNFKEVPLGYNLEEAVNEAKRCLQCKHKPCVDGCPVGVPIPEFIEAISNNNIEKAIEIMKTKNNLPAICGRVCPQEEQCELLCVMGKKNEPVAIGRLERFVGDRALQAVQETENADIQTSGQVESADISEETHVCSSTETGTQTNISVENKSEKQRPDSETTRNKKEEKVAVVGSGPAGLTAAADLAKAGYQVTLFEALHDTGGVLRYGIPEFRLPKSIVDQEVAEIKRLGVEIKLNVIIGKTITINELFENDYKAIFIGTGAGLPKFLNLPGKNLNGIYSANEFLTRVNLMKGYKYPEYHTPVKIGNKVAVIGGGNVAMDSARTALRLGADEVSIVYRRSEDELPARNEEIEHAKEEGIRFRLLNNPVAFHGKDGRVDRMECVKMELGEKDSSGRPRPIPIEDSNWELEVDSVIIAIGQNPNPLLTGNTAELETQSWGGIIVDENMATSLPGVYAGGDTVTGAATVIKAMGAGKTAAQSIIEYLSENK